MNAFHSATVEMGVDASVTSFTLADFARTLGPDSTSGTDHAWGLAPSDHGRRDQGRGLRWQLPHPGAGRPDDATNQGRSIPTTSLDEYGATLAQWFGVLASGVLIRTSADRIPSNPLPPIGPLTSNPFFGAVFDGPK
jgi:uncharacterized protein (DUF1501 family)